MTDITQTIITTLTGEAADAAEAGFDEVAEYFDLGGAVVGTKPKNGYHGEAWYDTWDPGNPGWAYRITPIVDGEVDMVHQDSGELLD